MLLPYVAGYQVKDRSDSAGLNRFTRQPWVFLVQSGFRLIGLKPAKKTAFFLCEEPITRARLLGFQHNVETVFFLIGAHL